ncbi:CPBP family intramembrane glutamic endopeptidase [Poritiphilus flavus]|uniref:CPBP family intramembrane metalloprotease n=1 Tax=Poritiphilus flavus TaxID=2697053 RepID=A0A6L9EFG2_9FLAO|nr:CPBP family intramembrane glutamic endopeptidase [Poritiphilus flavus]NAS13515.1 CPBP family intramembrane metalloprotease [Poritiphilus flavus]
MLKEVLQFLKHPVYEPDENRDLGYRITVFVRLLILSLAISIVIGIVIGGLESLVNIDLGQHAMDLLLEQYSLTFIGFLAIVVAPLLEEFFFRGPLVFFKKSSFFKLIFYLFTLAFGFYHITNFEITTTILVLSPLLVAPQLSVGVFLGFIRVRFGLIWAILLHACYNLVLVGPILLLRVLDIPLE